MEEQNTVYIGKRLAALREANNLNQLQLASLIGCDKSVISKIENGKRKDIRTHVEEYVRAMKCPEKLIEMIMRTDKAAIPDTSALLYNPRIISDICGEYSKVIIPDIILKELQSIKDRKKDKTSRQAWQVMNMISRNSQIETIHTTRVRDEKNDHIIINAAAQIAEKYCCHVDIITNDIDYSVLLKDNPMINAVHIKEYMKNRRSITNMQGLIDLDNMYRDSFLGVSVPEGVDINEYLPDGSTLIISAVRRYDVPVSQRIKKISWLIENGADVNKRDCKERFFPALTHAVQIRNGYELFRFLLSECGADPNTGSRDPFSTAMLRQQNEGNMPLMVAAWHGKDEFVKLLCSDSRTSINQQDTNGYTALIKSAIKRNDSCSRILLSAGADTRIVDLYDRTAADYSPFVREYMKKH